MSPSTNNFYRNKKKPAIELLLAVWCLWYNSSRGQQSISNGRGSRPQSSKGDFQTNRVTNLLGLSASLGRKANAPSPGSIETHSFKQAAMPQKTVSGASVRRGRGVEDCEPAVRRDWTNRAEWKIKAEKETGPCPEPVWSQAVRSIQCVLVTSSSLFPEHRPLLRRCPASCLRHSRSPPTTEGLLRPGPSEAAQRPPAITVNLTSCLKC